MEKIGLFDAKEQFASLVKPQMEKMIVFRDLFLQAESLGRDIPDEDLRSLMMGMYTIFDEIVTSLKGHQNALEWLQEHEGTECPIDFEESLKQASAQ